MESMLVPLQHRSDQETSFHGYLNYCSSTSALKLNYKTSRWEGRKITLQAPTYKQKKKKARMHDRKKNNGSFLEAKNNIADFYQFFWQFDNDVGQRRAQILTMMQENKKIRAE